MAMMDLKLHDEESAGDIFATHESSYAVAPLRLLMAGFGKQPTASRARDASLAVSEEHTEAPPRHIYVDSQS